MLQAYLKQSVKTVSPAPGTGDLAAVLGGIVDTAIALTEAEFGNIQLLYPDGHLRIVAHRGFPDWWLDYWQSASINSGACGRSLALGERVVVEDVEQSPVFANTPALDIQLRAGIHAVQSTPLRGSDGQILGMLSTHHRHPHRPEPKCLHLLDVLAAHAVTIIEREQMALALRTIDERFRLAMDAAEEGIWDWHIASGEVYYSPGFARMLGYDPSEINPDFCDWIRLLHPDDIEPAMREINRCFAGSARYSVEFRMQRKDGGYCWVMSRGLLVEHDADGNPARAVGTCIDVTVRRQIEQALGESEERLRLFIDHAPAALAMFDREMRYLAANQRWRDDYHLGDRELIGCSHYEVFPEIGEGLKAIHQRALAGETVRADEDCFVRADGSVQWLRWEVLPWLVGNARIGGIVIFSEDITARRNAEQALRNSESRRRRAQAAAKMGVWEWELATGINYWCDDTFRLFGITPGSVTPSYDAWLALMRPADRAAAAAVVNEAVAKGEEFELEWCVHDQNDKERWLLSRGQPEFDADGHLTRYLGIAMDITERRRAGQALEVIRASLAEAQKIAHLGSFAYNVADETTVWSDEQFRIHGLIPGDTSPTLADMLSRFIVPEDVERLRQGFLDAIASHSDFDQEHRLIHANGEIRWVHTVARPYYDQQGRLVRYVGTTLDITERKREEAEVQRHGEMMQSLVKQQVAVHTAAAFAHELNQPLVSIAAYSEVAMRALQGRKPDADMLAVAISGSRDQALRAGQVLHELLEHLQQGRIEPNPFDLNSLIEEVVTKLRKQEFRLFQLTLDLEHGLPMVHGNRLQTEKVLLNLIQNGLDAMCQAGVSPATLAIAVRTSAARDMAVVTVRDGGPGVAPDTAHRIFEPFFSTKRDGLGLGLTICRSLIEAQQGQLWLDPEDGPGAVFHFTLPLAHE